MLVFFVVTLAGLTYAIFGHTAFAVVLIGIFFVTLTLAYELGKAKLPKAAAIEPPRVAVSEWATMPAPTPKASPSQPLAKQPAAAVALDATQNELVAGLVGLGMAKPEAIARATRIGPGVPIEKALNMALRTK